MAYGLTCKGDAGTIQFDTDYRNLVLRTSGTHTSNLSNSNTYTDAWSVGVRSRLDIDITNYPNLLVAIRPNTVNIPWSVYYTTRSATNLSVYLTSNSTSTQTIGWWGFEYAPAAPGSGFGMKIRDSAGNAIWDNSRAPMIIAGVEASNIGTFVSGSYPTTPGSGVPQNAVSYSASGKTYAALFGSTSGAFGDVAEVDPENDPFVRFRQRGYWTSATSFTSPNNGITVSERLLDSSSSTDTTNSGNATYSPRNVFIIDVTGL